MLKFKFSRHKHSKNVNKLFEVHDRNKLNFRAQKASDLIKVSKFLFIAASPGMSRPISAMGGGGIYNNPTSLIDSPDGGPISGTENPLWIDQKYKAYEEQELTMTVFSDQVS